MYATEVSRHIVERQVRWNLFRMTSLIAAPHAYHSCSYFGSSALLGVRLEVSAQISTAEKMKLTSAASVVFTAALQHEKDKTRRGGDAGRSKDVGEVAAQEATWEYTHRARWRVIYEGAVA